MAQVKDKMRITICIDDLNEMLQKHADMMREFNGKYYVTLTATIFDNVNDYGNIGVLEGWHKESNESFRLGKIKPVEIKQQEQQQPRPKVGLFD